MSEENDIQDKDKFEMVSEILSEVDTEPQDELNYNLMWYVNEFKDKLKKRDFESINGIIKNLKALKIKNDDQKLRLRNIILEYFYTLIDISLVISNIKDGNKKIWGSILTRLQQSAIEFQKFNFIDEAINSYVQIANIYKSIFNDEKTAIKFFEEAKQIKMSSK